MPVATALLVASAASVVNVLVAAAFGGGTPLNRAISATCVSLALGAAAMDAHLAQLRCRRIH